VIKTPYRFEADLTEDEFETIGRFACRWAVMEHQLGNCLRRLLDFSPEKATSLIFPMNAEKRMQWMSALVEDPPLSDSQVAMFDELQPLIRAMWMLRNNVLHGILIDLSVEEEAYFHLRSKNRKVLKSDLFGCEDVINYTAHLVRAFRFSLGEKEDPEGMSFALPPRPDIPTFLGIDLLKLPLESRVERSL